jgi:AsmA protein
LRELNLNGTLSIQRLTMLGTLLENARVTLKAGEGQLRLHPFTAGLLGGQYEGDIRIDSRGDVPVIRFNEKLLAIPFKALAGDFFDYEQLSGLATGSIQGSTQGATLDALLQELGGNLALQLEDGALEGIDLWSEIRSAVALYKGEPAPTQNAGRTVFSNLQWVADIQNGLLQTRTMTGTLPFLKLNGGGSIDLRALTMDLRIQATVRDVPEVSNDPLAADLGGRKVPLVISGPLLDPAVKVDTASLLKGALTDQLLDRLGTDDDGDGEKDEVKDAARSLLKGLLDPDDDN